MKQETFELRLNKKPFDSIKAGTKNVELRLYDEKRQLINIGDYIIFKQRDNEENQIKVIVTDVDIYLNFEELYKHYNKISLGYNEDEVANYKDMLAYYPQEEQDKFGVVAISIKLI